MPRPVSANETVIRLVGQDTKVPHLSAPLSCHRTTTWVSQNVSLVHQLPLSRHGQLTDEDAGYRPNDALAIIAAALYGIFGAALSFRVIRTRAWWGLCLPIGAFCERSHPLFSGVLNKSSPLSSRNIGFRSPISVQIQRKQPWFLCHGTTIYHLRASDFPRLQLHHVRSPYCLCRHTTLDCQSPEGGNDIRH